MTMLSMLTALMVATTACSTDDPLDNYNSYITPTDGSSSSTGGTTSGTTGGTTSGSGELLTFEVNIDRTTAEPDGAATAYYPEDEDDISQNSFETEVAIDMSNPKAKTENGVTITVNGGHVKADHGSTKSICYVVSGTTSNGSLTILGDKKYEVKLSGADITNPDSAAINLLSKKRAFVVLDGQNKVTDGTTSLNQHKGAFYAKGKLLFSGTGSLEVYGNYNNGIHSADYIVFSKGNNVYVKSVANNGIKANDGVFINGGILNVEVSAAAAKGINSEADIRINGGRTTVITTGNGTYDTDDKETKAAAGIKADSTIYVNAGQVYLKSTGSGGKGLKADWEAYLNGGTIHVITEGSLYSSNGDTSSPKGIKVGTKNVHGVLQISGGDIMVRTKGSNGEGIESKGTLTITDGNVQVSAYDDAINSSGDMTISGGSVVAVGTNNDGLDSNGNLYIKGGTIIAMGAGGAEAGIDIDEQHKLYITGGYIFGIGGRIDGNLGSASQGIVSTSGSVTANSSVTVANGSSTIASFTMPPYSYSNGTILLSAPDMKSGTSYTLTLGSSTQTVTASSTLSSGGMGGGMPGGGGRPGGW